MSLFEIIILCIAGFVYLMSAIFNLYAWFRYAKSKKEPRISDVELITAMVILAPFLVGFSVELYRQSKKERKGDTNG